MNNNQSIQGENGKQKSGINQSDNFNPPIQNPTQDYLDAHEERDGGNLVTQQVTSTVKGPRRYHVKKVLATIFSLILLIIGVAAGVYLVQREQEFRERAGFGVECTASENCILLIGGPTGELQTDKEISSVIFNLGEEIREYAPPGTTDECFTVIIKDNNLEWQTLQSSQSCPKIKRVQVWTKR